jgi:hypothetical protein
MMVAVKGAGSARGLALTVCDQSISGPATSGSIVTASGLAWPSRKCGKTMSQICLSTTIVVKRV